MESTSKIGTAANILHIMMYTGIGGNFAWSKTILNGVVHHRKDGDELHQKQDNMAPPDAVNVVRKQAANNNGPGWFGQG